MNEVGGQLREASRDLIRRLQKKDAQFDDVAKRWRDNWNRKLPENRDDVFLIEEAARSGRLHSSAQLAPPQIEAPSFHFWQRIGILFGCFLLVISYQFLPRGIWWPLLATSVVGGILSYFDYLRKIWPRITCVSSSMLVLSAGLTPTFAKLTIGEGDERRWWVEALYNANQSELFSAFLILTGIIAIIASFRFVH